MLAEITDVCPEVLLMDEPLIELLGATDIKGCRQEEEGGGGK